MAEDLTLWRKIQNGDTVALKELHNRYYYQMIIQVRRMHLNHIGSDEVVSDCFIKLWTKRNEILIERSVRSYLFLMLRNTLIDHSRKKKQFIHVDSESTPEAYEEMDTEELDDYAKLYNALERLPDQRRRILELAVFDSCSYAQIAEKLQISVNTVKTQMGRAYRFLKEELDPKSIKVFFMIHSRRLMN